MLATYWPPVDEGIHAILQQVINKVMIQEYSSVQNVISYRLLSRNLEMKVHKIIILPVILNACETWSITLRKERRQRVSENKVLRRIFVPKRRQ
jgi:hypothetical protein